jgi:signal transduction histidine kinase
MSNHNQTNNSNQKIDESNVKNTLIANISHELRTPLNSIIGYINMLDDEKK